MVIEKPWVTHKGHNWLACEEYYNDIAEHLFIFSPPGNGLDCVRTWEALYLRTVPIVIKSIAMKEFSDLPIIMVDNWDQVHEEFLRTEYERIINTQYNLSKMRMSWWADRIRHFARTEE